MNNMTIIALIFTFLSFNALAKNVLMKHYQEILKKNIVKVDLEIEDFNNKKQLLNGLDISLTQSPDALFGCSNLLPSFSLKFTNQEKQSNFFFINQHRTACYRLEIKNKSKYKLYSASENHIFSIEMNETYKKTFTLRLKNQELIVNALFSTELDETQKDKLLRKNRYSIIAKDRGLEGKIGLNQNLVINEPIGFIPGAEAIPLNSSFLKDVFLDEMNKGTCGCIIEYINNFSSDRDIAKNTTFLLSKFLSRVSLKIDTTATKKFSMNKKGIFKAPFVSEQILTEIFPLVYSDVFKLTCYSTKINQSNKRLLKEVFGDLYKVNL